MGFAIIFMKLPMILQTTNDNIHYLKEMVKSEIACLVGKVERCQQKYNQLIDGPRDNMPMLKATERRLRKLKYKLEIAKTLKENLRSAEFENVK
jgi:cell shape-determining protein MreC